MLLLASTSDKLRLTTGSALATAVHASYVDAASGTITPGRQNTAISTATTTDIVSAPGASTYRAIKSVSIRNTSPSANVLTAIHTDGTTACELISASIPAGGTLHYDDAFGWSVHGPAGRLYVMEDSSGPAVSMPYTEVVLASDVVNNNVIGNTLQDITGFTFTPDVNDVYWVQAVIPYTSAATTTGSRWTLTVAGSVALWIHSRATLAATTQTINYVSAIDSPAACSASSLTAGNVAVLEAFVKHAVGGLALKMQFASEVSASAVTAKAGAVFRYYKLINN